MKSYNKRNLGLNFKLESENKNVQRRISNIKHVSSN
jgi:hypothetical protein